MTPHLASSNGLADPELVGGRLRMHARFESLAAILAEQARETPDRTILTALDRDGNVAETRRAAELDHDARRLATALLAIAAPGDRVLVPAMPGLGFHRGFLACLYAGLVAVPVTPIRVGGLHQRDSRGARRLGRLLAICTDAAPVAAVVASGQLDGLRTVLAQVADEHPELAALHLFGADVEEGEARDDLPGLRPVDPCSPAFLQYTSGSTSTPRGVVITHAAMMANQQMISARYAIGRHTTCVSWLPLYHDMGLCAGLLQPLSTRGAGIVMEPETFLVRPYRWLEALSHLPDAVAAAPDFAYRLVIARLSAELRSSLDLSGWRVALCGAEPVKPDTIRAFTASLADCGLPSTALTPAYGLAESTLYVTGNVGDEAASIQRYDREALGRGRGVRTTRADGVELVGAGHPQGTTRIAVVDPETSARVPESQVGELWVQSDSNGDGYWRQPEESRAVFGAQILGESGRGWLRTGDLGFEDDGEIVVTGRLKDLIIIRGVNYYPQDFERAVQSAHPALAVGLAAAFTDDADPERVRIAVEADRRTPEEDLTAAAAAAAAAASAELSVPVQVLVVDRGQVPRTTSGKVRRTECAQRVGQGEITMLTRWPRHD